MSRYKEILQSIPETVTLIAVSKKRRVDQIMELYDLGCRDFGENRVPELLEKKAACPDDIQWHFIGTLQKNKVNKLVGNCALIHSVDTLSLAEKISQVASKKNKKVSLLLQVNVSREESKHGFSIDECKEAYPQIKNLPNLNIQGLMTMAPFTEDEPLIQACFSKLKALSQTLKLPSLSMGMSQDYAIAIEEGATHIRLGQIIFPSH